MTNGADIIVRENAGISREQEPVETGVPWPIGRVWRSSAWRLIDPNGRTAACQTRVLACWPDGSIKWLLCSFLADVVAGQTAIYRLEPLTAEAPHSLHTLSV